MIATMMLVGGWLAVRSPAQQPTRLLPRSVCVVVAPAGHEADWQAELVITDARHRGVATSTWAYRLEDGTSVALVAESRDPASRYCEGVVSVGPVAGVWAICPLDDGGGTSGDCKMKEIK